MNNEIENGELIESIKTSLKALATSTLNKNKAKYPNEDFEKTLRDWAQTDKNADIIKNIETLSEKYPCIIEKTKEIFNKISNYLVINGCNRAYIFKINKYTQENENLINTCVPKMENILNGSKKLKHHEAIIPYIKNIIEAWRNNDPTEAVTAWREICRIYQENKQFPSLPDNNTSLPDIKSLPTVLQRIDDFENS